MRLRGLLEGLDVGYFEGDDLAALDPEGDALCNVNTPEEMAHARDRSHSDLAAAAGESGTGS